MTTTNYPVEKNPFDDEEDDDANNPFRSDDDDEESVQQIQKRHDVHGSDPFPAIVQRASDEQALFPITGRASSVSPEQETKPSSVKPSPLPRRSLNVSSDGNETSSSASYRSRTSQTDGPNDGQPIKKDSERPSSAFCPTPSPKVKRKAPSVPVVVTSSRTSLNTSPLPAPTSPSPGGRSKKTAPLPPPARRRVDSANERRKSSTDAETSGMGESLRNMRIGSNFSTSSLHSRRDSTASSLSIPRSDAATPDDRSLAEQASDTEDLERHYNELMESLKTEHHNIESELRDLIAIPAKLKTTKQAAREEKLVKDLMENVRKRNELEEETDDHETQHTLGLEGPTKKMKKKRHFRLKKLLGVKK
ncbi:hypothetical protein RvY_06053 [Ramazzottius varieornatus]|uniref:BMERB domain-containing protein n=1 Tax=Ramazzottius varieornatus TaxID=947166 RepID=A0A1D1V2Q1_RAMVA|nr:hypothetical protein RvY_06053 [Ramazzottius varieornatus]